jgi:protein-serine/threonine kinase
VKGHPNICPMLDFFEDEQYYYMIMPSTTMEPADDGSSPPSDLFDLVESYPHGLPPDMIRSYLGQIADAMAFLHSKGIGLSSLHDGLNFSADTWIVHRDIKDENVILGPNGKCILIDFGSSGLMRRNGWDTFSGT